MAALNEDEEFELLSLERERAFASTPGGAAVGNPNIQTQGRKAVRPDVNIGSTLGTIGGAGAIGAGFGAIGGDLMQGAGRFVGAFPQGRVIGPILENTGRLVSANRGAAATSGLIGGLAGESAGQTVEAVGGPQWAAETARFVGGAVTPELMNAAKYVLQKYAVTPALSVTSKAKKEAAKAILSRLEGGELKSLSEQEATYLNQLRDELRGGPKSDTDLQAVGNLMEGQAASREGQAIATTRSAESAALNINPLTGRPTREFADVGEELRGEINKRMAGMIEARERSFKSNQAQRDSVVNHREQNRQFVSQLPEYSSLIADLEGQLTPGRHSPEVQRNIRHILDQIRPAEKDVFGKNISPSFQSLDEVRRKLGDAFRGKPAEGYDAIGEGMAKNLYGRVSDIQKKYAGPSQAKLLDDYAMRTEGLEVFHSMRGKKATALDRYDPTQFATDPSSLAPTYFKTRAGVQALQELTGSKAMVNRAAMDYANRELQGATGPEVRAWLQKNSEWLGEVPVVRQVVDRFATRLEGAERGLANAKEFAAAASRDVNLLRGKSLPAQRAVDLIKSGSPELWEKAGPAIANSPQAKASVMHAARQVLADESTSAGVVNFYARNLRPFLERSQVTNTAELDFIAQKLSQIKDLKIPEVEKLGMAKRMLLNGLNTWAATGVSRGAAWSIDKMVPD